MHLETTVLHFLLTMGLENAFIIVGSLTTGGSPLTRFWPMYARVGGFHVSRGPPTIPLTLFF